MMEYVWLTALGLGVGAFGTMIGAGGGFILMPILLLFYPREAPGALTSVSLAVVCLNATSGSLSYAKMRRIDYKSGLLFLTVGVPGAVLGAMAVKYIPRQLFDLVFGVLLIAASAFIFFRPQKEGSPGARGRTRSHRIVVEADGTRHEYAYNLRLGMTLSFLVGFASSLLGIGGGIIHVPAMVHLLDFPVHVATATSHFILAGMALVGSIVHLSDGTLGGQWPHVVCLGGGAVAGAVAGAWLSSRIHGRWIMRGLAAALALVGARILVQSLWR